MSANSWLNFHMWLDEFKFDLPEELIAQYPSPRREQSRMLVLDRNEKTWQDRYFSELPNFIKENDLLVVNNTRVFPARLKGVKVPSGSRVELLLIKEIEENIWLSLARPARKLLPSDQLLFSNGGMKLVAEVIGADEDGRRTVRFLCDGNFNLILDEIGHTPLPPYIKRDDVTSANMKSIDCERYQTVFAKKRGAIAAPTAGLHFTPEIIDQIKKRGADVAEITLHVGYGTFAPVHATKPEDHRVASESYEINEEAVLKIERTRERSGRIVAIGTTTTRALESAAVSGKIRAHSESTDLTITPGFSFRLVDSVLTNFHLPQSSLLLLVCAFTGRELMLSAYKHAVAQRYRFYSYGDCMLIR